MPEKYDLAKDLTENEVNPDTLDKWEDSSYDSLNKATEAVVVAFLNDQDTQNEIKKS
ncbi:hypothetical protein IJM86_05720 [bacterium]|nr:hypothetical protein [bacterium]